MNIIEVKQEWPNNRLLINYAIHNVCNYSCWYCFPGSNTGEYRWPDLNTITNNVIHLLKYYQTHLGKTQFELNLLGGEPTLWPRLGNFVQRLKQEFGNNLQIMVTTNGSRTLAWWETNGHFFDKVLISCHPNESSADHIINVADTLYTLPVYVDVTVLMDPTVWDKAVGFIDTFKKSKKRWSIQTSQVIHTNVTYTEPQKTYLKKYLKRMPNLFWYYKNMKHYNYKNKIYFDNGKVVNAKKNYLLINNLNYFKGWSCNIGVDNITIGFTGDLVSSCGNNLYGVNFIYNMYQTDFIEKFNPVIKPTICDRDACYCQHEYNTSKHIIPIKAIC